MEFQEKVSPNDLLVFLRSWIWDKKTFRLGVFYLLGIVLSCVLVTVTFEEDASYLLLLLSCMGFGFLVLLFFLRIQFIRLRNHLSKKQTTFSLTEMSLKIDQNSFIPWKYFEQVREIKGTFFLITKEHGLVIIPAQSLDASQRAKVRSILFENIEIMPTISKRTPIFVTSVVVTIAGLYVLLRLVTLGESG